MLRLAFGISTAMRPDIILLDEIIGVGDQGLRGQGSPTAKRPDRVRKHPRSGLA